MNLQMIVSLAEIISALAITLTLIAVIISLRQNTKSQKVLSGPNVYQAVRDRRCARRALYLDRHRAQAVR